MNSFSLLCTIPHNRRSGNRQAACGDRPAVNRPTRHQHYTQLTWAAGNTTVPLSYRPEHRHVRAMPADRTCREAPPAAPRPSPARQLTRCDRRKNGALAYSEFSCQQTVMVRAPAVCSAAANSCFESSEICWRLEVPAAVVCIGLEARGISLVLNLSRAISDDW